MTERDELGRFITSNPDGHVDFLAQILGVAPSDRSPTPGAEATPQRERPEIMDLIEKGYEARREQQERDERAYLRSFGIDPDQLAEDAGS
jgi:hypothetical protein